MTKPNDRFNGMTDRFNGMTDRFAWLQIEAAASGCIDGTSDDWPALRHAITLVTGMPFVHRKSAQWMQGFCEGVLIQSGRNR